MEHDPRLTPARPDLAAASLKGQVTAERYAEPQHMRVAAAIAPLKPRPDPAAPLDSTLLYGCDFDVYETADGWCWGQSASDGYVGYVPAPMLEERGGAPSHRVAVPMLHLYAAPDIKAEPLGALYMNTKLAVKGWEDRFALLDRGVYAHAGHLSPLVDKGGDPVAIAQMLLHTPYLWGGNSAQGIDCSGLVQLALNAAGLECPRDSDQQESALGRRVAKDKPLMRGDLVFWKGHVGIMLGSSTLLHANQFAMCVSQEPLSRARTRIFKSLGDEIRTIKRLPARIFAGG